MVSAKARYEALRTSRDPYLQRARDCAKLTIPSLLPPDGYSGSSRLPTPWQTLGARCVNNLAARLLLSLFPPAAAFFKFSLDEAVQTQIAGDKAAQGEFDKAFSAMERSIVNEIESSMMRPALFQSQRHLINEGNVLLYLPTEGPLRLFRLDRYVVKRDPMGNFLELVTHEQVSCLELPEKVRAACVGGGDKKHDETEDAIDLYTRVYYNGSNWQIYQEINGKIVPGSQGSYAKDMNPWLPLRLIATDGEDYGRGMVEEYLGDFKSLEALSRAIVQGTAAAAKVLFLVKPNGTTKLKTISQSETGDVKEGNKEDVSVVQVDKYADFRVAKETRDSLVEALSYAFLLNSAIQRNGERVTAEEIRYMAQELEKGLGGIYSSLSQELQLPMVLLIQKRLQKKGILPRLPKQVKPTITTGLDALGRGNDRSRLTGFLQTMAELGFATQIDGEEVGKRLAAADGIDTKGLLKTAAQVQQEQQAAQAQELMAKGIGPAINQLGAAAATQQPTQ